jgi:hypothetical protein
MSQEQTKQQLRRYLSDTLKIKDIKEEKMTVSPPGRFHGQV